MPKMNSVFGTERLNLTYAVIMYVLKNEYVTVAKVAKHFEFREDEIVSILRSVNLTEPGAEFSNHSVPFDVNLELLKEGICLITSHDVDLVTPRITARQAAALNTGLKLLQQVRGYRKNKDLDALIKALHHDLQTRPPTPFSLSRNLRTATLNHFARRFWTPRWCSLTTSTRRA